MIIFFGHPIKNVQFSISTKAGLFLTKGTLSNSYKELARVINRIKDFHNNNYTRRKEKANTHRGRVRHRKSPQIDASEVISKVNNEALCVSLFQLSLAKVPHTTLCVTMSIYTYVRVCVTRYRKTTGHGMCGRI